jgi:hypothetical protein
MEPRPSITLLTDFGTADGYVGALKGVLASLCPEARIFDLTHEIEPGDVRGGAWALMNAASVFPPGTVHLAVVDPGVGTERRALLVEAGAGLFVGPDNGLLSLAAPRPRKVFNLDRAQWFRTPVSATFHGRDVFAPVAARAAAGVPAGELGTQAGERMLEIRIPPARRSEGGVTGEVFHADRFGNLVTTIRSTELPPERRGLEVVLGDRRLPLCTTYGDGAAGALVGLVGSSGFLEIASVGGSAAAIFGSAARPGTVVRVVAVG